MSNKNNKGSGTKPKRPDPSSNRSKKRANRKFAGLEVSCRKHRRMKSRLYSNPNDPSYMQPGKQHYH